MQGTQGEALARPQGEGPAGCGRLSDHELSSRGVPVKSWVVRTPKECAPLRGQTVTKKIVPFQSGMSTSLRIWNVNLTFTFTC